jgi:hypothetical protein
MQQGIKKQKQSPKEATQGGEMREEKVFVG